MTHYLLVAVLVLFLGTFSLSLRPAQSVMDTLLAEDGFYAAAVARNIAVGRGSTGAGLKRTNGFQPLFTFLSALMCFLTGGERIPSLRSVISFQCPAFIARGGRGRVCRHLCHP